ncbi:MAG TPA: hypothetical protein VFV87_01910 [Pirellulaceae bacterium]|nr:hypothetical protein [Pirellulaceae bacterium]
MNDKIAGTSRLPDEDVRFDRLVDGELSPDESRALLASLDDEPGGWRRCALAFLESHALTGELRGVRRSLHWSDDGGSSPQETPQVALVRQSPRNLRQFELRTLLAMAASFIVALGLGIVAPKWFSTGTSQPPSIADVPSDSPGGGVVASPHLRRESFKPIGNVQLVVDGPSGESTNMGNLPIYEHSEPLEEVLSNERPALPLEVLRSLNELGHQVERSVEYVPVQLQDGRRGYVPVEGYQITPAGRRSY